MAGTRSAPGGDVLTGAHVTEGPSADPSTPSTRASEAPFAEAPFTEDGTSAGQPPDVPPALTPWELTRWAWRQLTSMRTALVLLFLLAVAAVPGSLFPQRPENPSRVLAYAARHGTAAPVLARLGLFDVFHSAWFAAVYLALFVSLVGCVLPRSLVHLRAARSRPTLTPRNLLRLPVSTGWVTDTPPAEVLAVARQVLRPRGLARRHRLSRAGDPLAPVAAERGHLRETGNLVFHLALLVMLGGLAWSSLAGYKGTVIVVEGTGFSDTHGSFADFSSGPLVDTRELPPFSFTLDRFTATFHPRLDDQFGLPTDFDALLTFRPRPGAPAVQRHLRLNAPVKTGGAQVSLQANGYAPIIRVVDGRGRDVYQGPTVFLPVDANYTSSGVLKVFDARPRPLGITGFFLPTASPLFKDSVFPGATGAQQVRLAFFTGDLGFSTGPQSVYTLDTTRMTQLRTPTGQPFTAALTPGRSITLPGGNGTVTFLGYKRWINVQVASSPGTPLVLGAAIAAVLGLCGSLFVRRRRFWVRAVADGAGRTVVESAGLDRSRDPDVRSELDTLVAALQRAAPPLGSAAGTTVTSTAETSIAGPPTAGVSTTDRSLAEVGSRAGQSGSGILPADSGSASRAAPTPVGGRTADDLEHLERRT